MVPAVSTTSGSVRGGHITYALLLLYRPLFRQSRVFYEWDVGGGYRKGGSAGLRERDVSITYLESLL